MTMEPLKEENLSSNKSKKEIFGNAALEDLFILGYTTSEPLVVYEDEKGDKRIVARFRTLTPIELRKVYEESTKYSSFGGKDITEKLETLCFAIMTINGMPLVMSTGQREEYTKEYGELPSPLDQARHLIINQIKSIYIIDALYEAYEEFSNRVKQEFEDIKKKLKNPPSSN